MTDLRWDEVPSEMWKQRPLLLQHLRACGHEPKDLGLTVHLGHHTRAMARGARWLGTDDFPADQIWANEVESVLAFAASQGQFERALGRLRGDSRQRDATLAEFRVAFFLRRNGFQILCWEPDATGKPGDLLIQWPGTPSIFVETKAPDWQGELTVSERPHRKRLLKHVTGDGRFVDPVRAVLEVVAKNALPKLSPDRPNLVIVHDNLFLSPATAPTGVFPAQFSEHLSANTFERLGALLFVQPTLPTSGSAIEYATLYVDNTHALPACRIPGPVSTGLLRCNAQAIP